MTREDEEEKNQLEEVDGEVVEIRGNLEKIVRQYGAVASLAAFSLSASHCRIWDLLSMR